MPLPMYRPSVVVHTQPLPSGLLLLFWICAALNASVDAADAGLDGYVESTAVSGAGWHFRHLGGQYLRPRVAMLAEEPPGLIHPPDATVAANADAHHSRIKNTPPRPVSTCFTASAAVVWASRAALWCADKLATKQQAVDRAHR